MSHCCGVAERPFVFLHIGDLHVTQLDFQRASPNWQERERQLRQDLNGILTEISGIDGGNAFDFVYLPGDLAENGCANEYAFLAGALGSHDKLKIRLIPGDHDRQRGKDSLKQFEAFRSALWGAQRQANSQLTYNERRVTQCPPPCHASPKALQQYYYREDFSGVRCLFLDLVSAGRGQKGWGLDFRLGTGQTTWLRREIADARDNGIPCAVFMHCYPTDLHELDDRAEIAGLFWDGHVRIVEMGHTHYNQVAHDGRTMYAAARSVGQNEDGPVGYAVVALDGNVTSWRFKQLQLPWPFVMITSPADRRLATQALSVIDGFITVRALVLSDQPTIRCAVQCRADNGIWNTMVPVGGNMFETRLCWAPGSKTVTVTVTDDRTCNKDHLDFDMIEPALASDFKVKPRPDVLGSPTSTVGGWPVKGLKGDPQGPNNGGHQW